jgi:hypothetical protein
LNRANGQRTRKRRGVALITALALVALAGALVAGAFAAALATSRATRSFRASTRVDAAARRALLELVVDWGGALDSLPLGAGAQRPLHLDAHGTPMLVGRASVQRITESLFAASVDVRALEGGATRARRRYRMILERFPRNSTSPAAPPKPIPRWSVAELY